MTLWIELGLRTKSTETRSCKTNTVGGKLLSPTRLLRGEEGEVTFTRRDLSNDRHSDVLVRIPEPIILLRNEDAKRDLLDRYVFYKALCKERKVAG